MYTMFLCLFVLYTLVVFWISNYYILFSLVLINVILSMIFKVSFIKSLRYFKTILPLVIFTVLINIYFIGFENALLIGIRLLIVCNITYVFSVIMKPMYLAKAITGLLLPLKLFKINTNDIALMITITISFIPILSDEYLSIKKCLISRNYPVTLKRVVFEPQIFLINFIDSIFRRIDELENTLKAKGYN